jgi:Protein of unknown function (DUF4238)
MKLAPATPERWAGQMEKARAAGAITSDRDVSYEGMKKFVESGNYTMSLRTERHIQLEAGSFEKVLPFMFRRKWILLKAAKDTGGFITSDHPVCLVKADGEDAGVEFVFSDVPKPFSICAVLPVFACWLF